MAEQATIGLKEAAEILGCSPRRIRRLIKAGQLRAELLPGKWGAEYRIERQSLPESLPTMPAAREAPPTGGPAVQLLADLLRDTQARLEGAAVRLGQLEGEREQRLELTARAESLGEERAELVASMRGLRSALRLRTWTAAIAMAGFVLAVAATLLR